jgi:hypothetical protein
MTVAPEPMRQEAPYPEILAGLVDRLRYRAGWLFALRDIDRGQGSSSGALKRRGSSPDTAERLAVRESEPRCHCLT